jgi:hypothetical protein
MSVPVPSPVTGSQRVAAAVALLSAGLTVLLAVAVAIIRFPSGLGVLLCIAVGDRGGVVRRGAPGGATGDRNRRRRGRPPRDGRAAVPATTDGASW